jgi:NTE family protein
MFGARTRGAEEAGSQSVGNPQAAQATPPVIGLALGGGAARGWAHIGILAQLDEAGIRPQVIAGTSIGAVVGGSWAAGKLGELEVFARGLTKRSMLSLMDLHLMGSGLLTGDRLRKQLDERFKDMRVEELPVRFAAVATEIRHGHEVWLTRGPLSDAMRASYALPGIFVPVNIAGRWLMDGALCNPVPVSVARALGAEVIIAVNLHTDVLGRSGVIHEHGVSNPRLAELPSVEQDEAYKGLLAPVYGAANMMRRTFGGAPAVAPRPSDSAPGIMSVMLDAFNITQDRIARSRLAGDPPDITITPKLGNLGLSEFHRAEEAIAAGRAATLRVLDDIKDIQKALTVRRG